MAFRPIVPRARLAKDKVVWSEDLAERATPNAIHGAGLQVNEDGPGDVFAATGLIVVDIDALELQLSGALVGASGVDAVLVRDNFPKLKVTWIWNSSIIAKRLRNLRELRRGSHFIGF